MYILFLLFIVSESRILNENLKNIENVNFSEKMNQEQPDSLRRTKRFSSRFFSNQLGMDQWATHDSYRLIRSDMFQNKRKKFNKTVKVRIPTEDLLAAKLKSEILKMGRKRLLKNKRNISGLKMNIPRPSRIWDFSQNCYLTALSCCMNHAYRLIHLVCNLPADTYYFLPIAYRPRLNIFK